ASALADIGGVSGALAKHADEVVAGLGADARGAVRRITLRLVTAAGTRAHRTAAELEGDTESARVALEALIRGRLVVAGEAEGERVYELAHEALIHGWDTLRRWRDAEGDIRHVRERIDVASAEWVRVGKAEDALYGDRQLAELSRVDERELDRRALEFVAASRRRALRARLRRWGTILAAPLAIGLLLAGVRLKAQRDLGRVVEGHDAKARTALAEGKAKKEEAEERRRRAFALFDSDDVAGAEELKARLDAAEKAWTEALDASRAAEAALASASQS